MHRDRLLGDHSVADQLPARRQEVHKAPRHLPPGRVEGHTHRTACGRLADLVGPARMIRRHHRHIREPFAQLGGSALAADDVEEREVVELGYACDQPPDRRTRGSLHQKA